MLLGVSGVLGYYHAQLNDMIQYPDLRTEVFQSFREIGNAIIFCLLVEQSLVSNATRLADVPRTGSRTQCRLRSAFRTIPDEDIEMQRIEMQSIKTEIKLLSLKWWESTSQTALSVRSYFYSRR